MKYALLLCSLVLSSLSIFAQDYFEGEISYTIEYLQVPEGMKEMQNFLPTKMKFMAKGTQYKVVNEIPEKDDQVNVMNNFDGSGFLLMNFLGHKIALINDPEEVHKENAVYFQAEVEDLNEEKDLLGYECEKVRFICDGDTSEVYFTSDFLSPEYKYMKLKGLPLEYVSSKDGLILKVTATEIEEKEISEIEFVIPTDYEEMTKDELEELFEM